MCQVLTKNHQTFGNLAVFKKSIIAILFTARTLNFKNTMVCIDEKYEFWKIIANISIDFTILGDLDSTTNHILVWENNIFWEKVFCTTHVLKRNQWLLKLDFGITNSFKNAMRILFHYF